MKIADERAIRITELNEELVKAKKIIEWFVWPPDDTEESRQRTLQAAARFAGCSVPQFKLSAPERSS